MTVITKCHPTFPRQSRTTITKLSITHSSLFIFHKGWKTGVLPKQQWKVNITIAEMEK